MSLMKRYPHGVLTEQEGGVPNDALNYDDATHTCRKHRVVERVCRDVGAAADGGNPTGETVDVAAIRAALDKATPGPWATAGWHDKTIITERWSLERTAPKDRGPFMAAGTTSAADAELIVLLRNNAEALLDALTEAEAKMSAIAEVLQDRRLWVFPEGHDKSIEIGIVRHILENGADR